MPLSYDPVVIDTETNAIPDYKLPADHPDQPRLAALGMLYLDRDLKITSQYSALIRPDGWQMTQEATNANGLTDELLAKEGVPVREALVQFSNAITLGCVALAHNVRFDLKIIRGELRRAGMPDLFEQTQNVCLMRSATAVCAIPSGRGRALKWPSLLEAYTFFYGVAPGGQHTAIGDAYAGVEIMRALFERNALILPAVHYAKEKP